MHNLNKIKMMFSWAFAHENIIFRLLSPAPWGAGREPAQSGAKGGGTNHGYVWCYLR